MRQLIILFSIWLLSQACGTDSPKLNPSDSLADTVSISDSGQTKHDSLLDSIHGIGNKNCAVLYRNLPNLTDTLKVQTDLSELLNCGVDSFDFLYVVPNLFPNWASEKQYGSRVSATYGDFVKHLNEFRTTDSYVALKQRVVTLDSLRAAPFDKKKLYSMKPVLGKLGFTEPEWNQFSGFVNTFPIPDKKKMTWGDMLEEFEKYRPSSY
jgi:hypothetical protein